MHSVSSLTDVSWPSIEAIRHGVVVTRMCIYHNHLGMAKQGKMFPKTFLQCMLPECFLTLAYKRHWFQRQFLSSRSKICFNYTWELHSAFLLRGSGNMFPLWASSVLLVITAGYHCFPIATHELCTYVLFLRLGYFFLIKTTGFPLVMVAISLSIATGKDEIQSFVNDE